MLLQEHIERLEQCGFICPDDGELREHEVWQLIKQHVLMKELFDRPDRLDGMTTRIRIPPWDKYVYVTINKIEDTHGPRIVEVFFKTKHHSAIEWFSTMSIMISAVCRREDPLFLFQEMQTVESQETSWMGPPLPGDTKGGLKRSVVAALGRFLENQYNEMKGITEDGTG